MFNHRRKTLPVLDAAHIIPFSENGPNISNGILLRTDIHTLFDKGYITIDENYIVEVSKNCMRITVMGKYIMLTMARNYLIYRITN